MRETAYIATLLRALKRAARTAVLAALVLSLLSGSFPTPAYAANSVPKVLNYQARVTDSGGVPVPNGALSVIFRLYDGDGTCLYSARGSCGTPTAKSVTVTNGVFSTQLGEAGDNEIPDGLFDNNVVTLGITIGADAEMTPRKRLTAAAYALNADRLDDLDVTSSGSTTAYIPSTTANGNLVITGDPQGTGVGNGSLYINPANASASETLFGIADNGGVRFQIDKEGDITHTGSLLATAASSTAQFVFRGAASQSNNIFEVQSTITDRLFSVSATATSVGAGARFIVGTTNTLVVNSSGNFETINGLPARFPSSQGALGSVLRNDGSGNFTWVDASGLVNLNQAYLASTSTAEISLTPSIGALTIADTFSGTGNIFEIQDRTNAAGDYSSRYFTVSSTSTYLAGNVGVGTAPSSQYKIDVLDTSANGAGMRFINSNVTNSNGVFIQTQTSSSGDAALNVTTTAGANTAFTVRGNGTVGMGATPPTASDRLYVTSSEARIKLSASGGDGNDAAFWLTGGATNASWMMLTNRSSLNGTADSLGFYKASGTTGTKLVIQDNGNVGIGNLKPASRLTVGSGTSTFEVDESGNILKINNVVYSWPSSQGAASTVLQNNGAGTLSWVAANGLVNLNQAYLASTSTAEISLTPSIGALTIADTFSGTGNIFEIQNRTNAAGDWSTKYLTVSSTNTLINTASASISSALAISNPAGGTVVAITSSAGGVEIYGIGENGFNLYSDDSIFFRVDANGDSSEAYSWLNGAGGTVMTLDESGILALGSSSSTSALNTANARVTGNLTPSVDNTYSLGDPALRWKDLWLSGGSANIAYDTSGTTIMQLGFNTTNGLRGLIKTPAEVPLTLRAGNQNQGITIDAAGNVGIGTQNPQYSLHIAGSLPAMVINHGTESRVNLATGGTLRFIINQDATSGTIGTNGSGGNLFIQAGGSNRLNFYTTSVTGLNTLTPSAFLSVASTVASPTFNVFEIQNRTNTGGDYSYRYFTVSSTSTLINPFNNLGHYNVGIGNGAPANRLTVGSTTSTFEVDFSGDIRKINNVIYSWPSSQGAASTVLQNNGAGTLSWVAANGLVNLNQAYLAATGSPEISITPSIGALTIADTLSGTGNVFEVQNRTTAAGDYSQRYLTVSATSVAISSNAPTATLHVRHTVDNDGTAVRVTTFGGTDLFTIDHQGNIVAGRAFELSRSATIAQDADEFWPFPALSIAPVAGFAQNLIQATVGGTPMFMVGPTGLVGIGNSAPANRLTVGSATSTFEVNAAGNLIKVNNVPYSWPASQGGSSTVLQNDGNGNLSWAAAGGSTNLNQAYLAATGSPEISLTPSIGALTIADTLSGTGNIFEIQNRTTAAGDWSTRYLTVSATATTIANQIRTTYTAGPALVLATAESDNTIQVTGDGNFGIYGEGGMILQLDSDNDGSNAEFVIVNGAFSTIFAGSENGRFGVGNLTPTSLNATFTAAALVGTTNNIFEIGNSDLSQKYFSVSATATLVNATNNALDHKFSIGNLNPANRLTVGSATSTFEVNQSGNLVKINNVPYSWPSSQGGASTVLQNDGNGNLSWAAAGGSTNLNQAYLAATGSPELSITPSVGALTIGDTFGGTGNIFEVQDRTNAAGDYSIRMFSVSATGTRIASDVFFASGGGNDASVAFIDDPDTGFANGGTNRIDFITAGQTKIILEDNFTLFGSTELIVNGGVIDFGASSGFLAATPTILEVGGAATTLIMGANGPGTTRIRNSLVVNGDPQGTGLSNGTVYVNPSAPTGNETLFSIANNGSLRFKLDAEGDIDVTGSMLAVSASTTSQFQLRGFAAQSNNIFEVQDSFTNRLFSVSSTSTRYINRLIAPAHAVNQGLQIPTFAGVPTAVTGTAEGDIVWNSTGDALYVYNGAGFTELSTGSTPTMNATYLAATGTTEIYTNSTQGALTIADTLSGTGNIFEVQNRTTAAGDYSSRYFTVSSTSVYVTPLPIGTGTFQVVASNSVIATTTSGAGASPRGQALAVIANTSSADIHAFSVHSNNVAGNAMKFAVMTNGKVLIGGSSYTPTATLTVRDSVATPTHNLFEVSNSLNTSPYFTISSTATIIGSASTTYALTTTGARVTGNLTPSADNTYTLGDPALRWKDLWLSGGSANIAYDTSGTSILRLGWSDTNGRRALIHSSGQQIQITPSLGDSQGISISPSGLVGIGTTNPIGKLDIQSTSTSVYLTRFSTDNNGNQIVVQKARGSSGSELVVENGDDILNWSSWGYDGDEYIPAAFIKVSVDDTPGNNDMPGRITFMTTANGSSTSVERMRLNNAGNLAIGTNAPSARLTVADDAVSPTSNIFEIQNTSGVGGYTHRYFYVSSTGTTITNLTVTGTCTGCGGSSTMLQTFNSSTSTAELFANGTQGGLTIADQLTGGINKGTGIGNLFEVQSRTTTAGDFDGRYFTVSSTAVLINPGNNITAYRLGINTATPSAPLHITGASETFRIQASNGTGNSGLGYITFFDQNNSTRRGYIGDADTGNTDLYLHAETGALRIGDSSGSSALILTGGRLGLGNTSPANKLTVGTATSTFEVNAAGNLIKVNNVPYSWPASQGGGSTVLQNDGSGNLSWSVVSSGGNLNQAYLAATGSPEISITPSVGALTIADTLSGTGNVFEVQNRTTAAGDYSQRYLTVSATSVAISSNAPTATLHVRHTVDNDGTAVRVTTFGGTDIFTIDHQGNIVAGRAFELSRSATIAQDADEFWPFPALSIAPVAGFAQNLIQATVGGTPMFMVGPTGLVGIGNSAPANKLTVGTATSTFEVNQSGNLVKINNVPYSWPSSQGGASTFLQNNGSGTLTWVSAPSAPLNSAYLAATGSPEISITPSVGALTIGDTIGGTGNIFEVQNRTNAAGDYSIRMFTVSSTATRIATDAFFASGGGNDASIAFIDDPDTGFANGGDNRIDFITAGQTKAILDDNFTLFGSTEFTVNGGTIDIGASFGQLAATPPTLEFAFAATDLTMGATTGTTTIRNSLTVGSASTTHVITTTGARITGNLTPSADNTYSLGDYNRRWKDLWLSGGSAKIAYDTSGTSILQLGWRDTNGRRAQIYSSGQAIQIGPQHAETSGIYIASSGSVGIGTASPSGKLHISDTTGTTLRIANTNSGATLAQIEYTEAGSLIASIGIGDEGDILSGVLSNSLQIHGSNSLHLGTADTARLTIDSSGEIGIGDSTPNADLDILTTRTNSNSLQLQAQTITTGNAISVSLDDISSGAGLLIENISTAAAMSTGSMILLNQQPTYTTTTTSGGSTFRAVRQPTINGSAQVLTLSAAVGEFSDGCITTLGTCTHTADVLRVEQNNTAASGAGLQIDYAGTGLALRVEDDGGNYGSDSTPFSIDAGGQVHIGGTAPGATLDVEGNIEFDINPTGDTTIGVCKDTADSFGDVEFRECSSTPSDVAEWYALEEAYPTGTLLIATDAVISYQDELFNPLTGVRLETYATNTSSILTESTAPYEAKIIGVISTNPYQSFGKGVTASSSTTAPVALIGRVPTRVTAANGVIRPGDPLTTSSISGVAMKATKPGMIVGFALDHWEGPGEGKIEIFVNPGFHLGLSITNDGASSIFADDFAFKPLDIASATGTAFSSYALKFGGSAWSSASNTAVTRNITIRNDVTSDSAYQLTFKNDNGQTLASLNQAGDLALAGSLTVNGGLDYAETFPAAPDLDAGDIVMVDAANTNGYGVKKSDAAYENTLLGVISTKPGFLTGKSTAGTQPVALAGRVPVKVNTESGEIKPGDPITSSSTPGVGMKAAEAGRVIGIALEGWNGSGTGRITVFVNPSWWNGPAALAGATAGGALSITGESLLDFKNSTLSNVSAIVSTSGLWSVSSDGYLVAEHIEAKEVNTRKLTLRADAAADRVVGKARLRAGYDAIMVENPHVTEESVIVITFEGNPGSNWWVSEKHQGSFILKLAQGAIDETPFTYWILPIDGLLEQAAVEEEAPQDEPTESGTGTPPTGGVTESGSGTPETPPEEEPPPPEPVVEEPPAAPEPPPETESGTTTEQTP
ncbi:MAG: hypothetical protein QY323_04160 [Patescibacteria group bacterium]|nr:MAG: hypothetical protein QY323_04160 [Patescibacteria group bacterium]